MTECVSCFSISSTRDTLYDRGSIPNHIPSKPRHQYPSQPEDDPKHQSHSEASVLKTGRLGGQTYRALSARIEFPPRIEMVEIHDGVENEEIAPDSRTPVHRIIREQNAVSLPKGG